jgi:hypothetical protein
VKDTKEIVQSVLTLTELQLQLVIVLTDIMKSLKSKNVSLVHANVELVLLMKLVKSVIPPETQTLNQIAHVPTVLMKTTNVNVLLVPTNVSLVKVPQITVPLVLTLEPQPINVHVQLNGSDLKVSPPVGNVLLNVPLVLMLPIPVLLVLLKDKTSFQNVHVHMELLKSWKLVLSVIGDV